MISGTTVANINGTTVRGDIGAATQPSGFPPGVIVGNIQDGPADATAYNDMLAAYTEVQSRTGGTALPALTTGTTLTPGLYTRRGRRRHPRGDRRDPRAAAPNAVFVIQVNGALSLGAGAKIKLTGGAQASNVFWPVNGAFRRGANAQFAGTVMATTTGTVGTDLWSTAACSPKPRSRWTPTTSTAPRRR